MNTTTVYLHCLQLHYRPNIAHILFCKIKQQHQLGEVNICYSSSFVIHPRCCVPKIRMISLNLQKLYTKQCCFLFLDTVQSSSISRTSIDSGSLMSISSSSFMQKKVMPVISKCGSFTYQFDFFCCLGAAAFFPDSEQRRYQLISLLHTSSVCVFFSLLCVIFLLSRRVFSPMRINIHLSSLIILQNATRFHLWIINCLFLQVGLEI